MMMKLIRKNYDGSVTIPANVVQAYLDKYIPGTKNPYFYIGEVGDLYGMGNANFSKWSYSEYYVEEAQKCHDIRFTVTPQDIGAAEPLKMTTAVVVGKHGDIHYGTALCSPCDEYDANIGRAIALARALGDFEVEEALVTD